MGMSFSLHLSLEDNFQQHLQAFILPFLASLGLSLMGLIHLTTAIIVRLVFPSL